MTATYAPTHHPAPTASQDASPATKTAALDSRPSRKALWAGRILSGLAVLFMLFDAAMKVLELPVAVQGTTQLGYPESVVFGLGLVQLVCLAVYLLPRTSVLGAVLWTGYLGGAIATHVRLGNPLFSHVLFPTYVAAFLWLGLWLRDERLRAVLPLRATK
jgi:DoxX-like family